MMLTDAVLAPGSIPPAPIAITAIPNPNNAIPIAHFIFAFGLYLLSHHLENKGAKVIMYNEFKTENQDAGISAESFWNSSFNIQIAMNHIITKLKAKKILDQAYFANVLLNNKYKTHEINPKGIIVNKEFTILNMNPASPSKTLSV